MSEAEKSAAGQEPGGSSNDPQRESGSLAPAASKLPVPAEQITKAIEKMPAPVREMFEMMAVATSADSPHHPLFDKFNDGHVGQFLENIKSEELNNYKLRSSNRWFHLAYVFSALIALGLLVTKLLPQHKDLLVNILQIIVAFAGGIGSGFGIKAHIDRNREE